MANILQAIKMDEQIGDNLTSSMVDYVFFVLQQSSQRAVETHNINGLCPTVNHIVQCLKNYKKVPTNDHYGVQSVLIYFFLAGFDQVLQ
jgi:COG4 transport protein